MWIDTNVHILLLMRIKEDNENDVPNSYANKQLEAAIFPNRLRRFVDAGNDTVEWLNCPPHVIEYLESLVILHDRLEVALHLFCKNMKTVTAHMCIYVARLVT